MITEKLAYKIPSITKEENQKMQIFMKNMITKSQNGKNHLQVKSFSLQGGEFYLTVAYDHNLYTKMRSSILGGINKSLGAKRAF